MDKDGKTIDFVKTKQQDKAAARRYLNKAIGRNGLPEKITIDGRDANTAAMKIHHEEPCHLDRIRTL